MLLSVVIPTYNRESILAKCIEALFKQTLPPDRYEIIVVNDGSTDGTNHTVKMISSQTPVEIRYLEQDHRGPAAARNLAIKNSSGQIILIIGDDIIATPNLLEEHMNWHLEFPEENIAVLGYVTWSEEMKKTPFLEWLERSRFQFGYHLIQNDTASFWFFYTCNISIKKEFLINHGLFDEDFPYAAYEDTDLGYRLMQEGLQIKYNRNAVGHHYHPGINLYTFRKRMVLAGENEAIFSKKHPELPDAYKGYFKKISNKKKRSYLWAFIYEQMHNLRLLRLVKGIKWRTEQYYLRQVIEAFLEGYNKRRKLF